MSKTETARDYRLKYGDDTPIRKLSRIMYRENRLLFKDEEEARSFIRYIERGRGRGSGKNRLLGTARDQQRPINPYKIPQSEELNYRPFVISGYNRVGILSDMHIPFHNLEATTRAIGCLKKEKIDALLLLGDMIDAHTLSKFLINPNSKKFKYELDAFKDMINVFEKNLGCKIFFKIGNHEERYEKFLYQKSAELEGIDEFKFENIIKARARGIEVIGDKRVIKLNGLSGIHGHEYGDSRSSNNVAKRLYLKAKTSAFQGHSHTTDEYNTVDINGKTVTTWSVGCLCELHPPFMPLNNWNHGFAIVDLDKNGNEYEFRNKRIG